MVIAVKARRASNQRQMGAHARQARTAALAALVAAFATSHAVHAESELDFKLAVGESYIDNLFLVAPDAPVTTDWVTQVNPEVVYKTANPRLKAALQYTMQNLWYANTSDLNDTFHNLDASADWTAVPDWLNVIGRAIYSQHIVDPERSVNIENLFASSNLADYGTASITPAVRHNFGSVSLDTELTYGFLNYDEHSATTTPGNPFALDDSVNTNFIFRLHGDDEAKFGWGVDYQNDYVDYDTARSYRYERALLSLSYGIGRSLRLIGEGGEESDLSRSTSAGGLDSSVWRAGFRWQPSRQTSMQAMIGERFFGHTYLLQLSHEARLLRLSIDYTEEPTTESQSLLYSSATPGDLPEKSIGIDTSRISPGAYISKRLEAKMSLIGSRTEITARVYSENRDYLTPAGFPASEEDYVGGGIAITRQFGPKTDIHFNVATNETKFLQGGSSRDNRVDGILTRKFTPSLVGDVQLSYLDRWGDGATDYKAWYGTIRVEKTF
jgi:hypothetical protein